MFAKGGTGKSLLALWLAAGLATGTAICSAPASRDRRAVPRLRDDRCATSSQRLEDMGYDDPRDPQAAALRLAADRCPARHRRGWAGGGRHGRRTSAPTWSSSTRSGGPWTARRTTPTRCGRGIAGRGSCSRRPASGSCASTMPARTSKRGQRGTSAKNDDVDVVWEMVEREHGEFLPAGDEAAGVVGARPRRARPDRRQRGARLPLGRRRGGLAGRHRGGRRSSSTSSARRWTSHGARRWRCCAKRGTAGPTTWSPTPSGSAVNRGPRMVLGPVPGQTWIVSRDRMPVPKQNPLSTCPSTGKYRGATILPRGVGYYKVVPPGGWWPAATELPDPGVIG